ncbi:MAG: hypothetical protein KKE12_09630, partial [Proteobacteria bacterium]|nr:hypothetical protein [Pseudomonadota bacterium]
QAFFKNVQSETIFGIHYGCQFIDGEIDFIKRIEGAAFAEIGKFKLIDEKIYGEEYHYFIPEGSDDFEKLEELIIEFSNIKSSDFDRKRLHQMKIENLLKRMAGRIVHIRLGQNDVKPIAESECCGILKLSKECYNSTDGIRLSVDNQIL